MIAYNPYPTVIFYPPPTLHSSESLPLARFLGQIKTTDYRCICARFIGCLTSRPPFTVPDPSTFAPLISRGSFSRLFFRSHPFSRSPFSGRPTVCPRRGRDDGVDVGAADAAATVRGAGCPRARSPRTADESSRAAPEDASGELSSPGL